MLSLSQIQHIITFNMSGIRLITHVFLIFFLCCMSLKLQAQEEWIPTEFKHLMKEKTQSLDIYHGDLWLGKFEVKHRLGSVRLPDFAKIIKKIRNVDLKMKSELLAYFSNWLPDNINQQCYYDDIRNCDVYASDIPFVIFDEARLRLRIGLPSKYLTFESTYLTGEGTYLPKSDQRHLTFVQGLELAFSGDNYNLSGESISSLGEYRLSGAWSVYNHSAEGDSFDFGLLAIQHDQDGVHWSAGLIDSSAPAVWNAFRAIPSYTMIGFQIATSSNTLRDKKTASSSLLTAYLPNSGRVDIYRDGRLLSSQPALVGINVLNTDTFPYGVYEVELRGFSGSIQVFAERQLFVKSSWLPNRVGGNLALNLGKISRLGIDEDVPIISTAWSDWFLDNQALKAGTVISSDWQRAELGILGVWPLNYNFSIVADSNWLGIEVFSSVHFENVFGTMELRKYDRIDDINISPVVDLPKNSLTTTLSYLLYPGHRVSYRYNYREKDYNYLSGEKRYTKETKYISRGIDYNFTLPISNKYFMRILLGSDIANTSTDLAYLNFSFLYSDEYQGSFGTSFRKQGEMNDIQSDMSVSWRNDDNIFFEKSDYNMTLSNGSNTNAVGLGMSFDSVQSTGRIAIQSQQSKLTNNTSTDVFGSLRTFLAFDEYRDLSWGKGSLSYSTGIVVDLSDSSDIGKMELLVNNTSFPVYTGRKNWIPLKPFNVYSIRLRDKINNDSLVNIRGRGGQYTLYPGNVINLSYKVEEDEVLFGLITGDSIKNGNVIGRFPSSIDSQGQFQARIPKGARELLVKSIRGEYCLATLPSRNNKNISSVGALKCHEISIKEASRYINEFQIESNIVNNNITVGINDDA